MGLDMYAYAVDAKLVDGQPDTDVPIHKIVLEAVDFKHLSNFELDAITEDQRNLYWDSERAATEHAKRLGLVDYEFYYWRKHHDLHGWMGGLYLSKGGANPDFNCNTLRLTSKDLDELESSIKDRQLPATRGFFFGDNPPDEESDDYDLDFIKKAREAINSGKAVFYDSWW